MTQMSEPAINPDYVFLDDQVDRQQFLDRMHAVRQDVLDLLETIASDDLYKPRYHGWTPAAMLSHLNTIDNLSMLQIRMALLGLRPTVSMTMLNQWNDFTARIFCKRLLTASIKSLHANEKRIGEFIMRLPVNRFAIQVHDPTQGKFLTIEQFIQERFLFHWQLHLATMREAEDIQPSEPSDNA